MNIHAMLDDKKLALLEERMGVGAVDDNRKSSPDTKIIDTKNSNVARGSSPNQKPLQFSSPDAQQQLQHFQNQNLENQSSVELFGSNSNSNSMHQQKEAWKKLRSDQVNADSADNSRDGSLSAKNIGIKREAPISKDMEYLGSEKSRSPTKHTKTDGNDKSSIKSPTEGQGSREATLAKQQKISSYFVPGESGEVAYSSRPRSNSEDGSTGNLNTNSPPFKKDTSVKPSFTQGSGGEKLTDHPSSSSIMSSISNASNAPTSLVDQRRLHELEQRISRLDADLQNSEQERRKLAEGSRRQRSNIEDMHRAMAQQEQRRRRDRLASDCVRLGKLVTQRTGPTSVAEVWEEGWALKDMTRRSAAQLVRKEELEKRKKRLAIEKRKRSKGENGSSENSDVLNGIDLDIAAEEAAIRSHQEELKKDSEALSEERKLLEAEKAAHLKELRRCHSEDHSRFAKDLPCLNQRYLLTFLLGRGGFSEVWKAYDLVELRDVAVKVHQLNNTWNDERKQSYIKHVTREYTIHRDMQHPRVVSLYDVFEIDLNSFATVLEYCRGTDLDEKLKRLRTIAEKDARTILLQILSGMRYMNNPSSYKGLGGAHGGFHGGTSAQSSSSSSRKSIIHYDLKPANILFDEMGDAKITDFGLSKIIDSQSEGTSMELTSQGAGTYWYLPPECFEENPRISTKVDVWSIGVIFYQMLFGKRPFGEGRSQERILQEGIIRHASQVDFPDTPKVSEEAKEFIRMCLTANQNLRPDMLEICNNPYCR